MISKKIKVIFIIILSGILCGSVYYILNVHDNINAIESYDSVKHHNFMLQQFKENWELLISSPNYDVQFMLDQRAPNSIELEYVGVMDIKIIHDNEGHPAGFITYYMRSTYQGEILFLEVAKEFRGKKYAQKLLRYAFDALKAKGAKIVRLATRITNIKAQKVYTDIGFKETGRARGFIYYRRSL